METNLDTGPGLVGAVIGFLFNIAVPFGLFAWGRSVAKRRGGRGWRLASYLPLVAALASMVGVFLTVLGLIQAFGAVAQIDPSSKARVLSEGIATAMWSTAIGMGLSIALYIASVVTFAAGELTKPRTGGD
jgi:hypothetical protein